MGDETIKTVIMDEKWSKIQMKALDIIGTAPVKIKDPGVKKESNKGKGREGGDESLDVERSMNSCGENSDTE
nr:15643_t:CDS:2 [Entrophospora candida]